MKAGGRFVLLDASQSVARLSVMCQRTRPQILLASAKHVAVAEELGVPFHVIPHAIASLTAPVPPDRSPRMQPASDAHHILYAGFTSGSTGEPKGVVIGHSAFSYTQSVAVEELTYNSDGTIPEINMTEDGPA
ncbi:hypothetical protein ABOM_012227 [Aspergillus bombycis]|uniref:AMP-dependent synthetase/ligase domain-containing protein n=1 Tax=Aspergillus bombycis TaxID=109264 RepID=A0A1F7ZI91_9EURO|nr:hypothetical protein ABOM_012227 [Aspergillus bombycis]OGM39173.1 hypothetical protein ABOM_012227 [Aspergillus bombycis]